mmetsp:Transcript_17445/g.31578  ORF Transcript_17445/g.31578 Transcript_17445/m.31578 type:complete len:359 (+) Transcript_17445:661-1737(+)|eukprot:CAMPEP_0201888894 /NCGR_PEP_ID=MMETSP0902-20130614/28672_1 /ASSEMBLY_ACC=CAM_ASM_000551 /TAXON_ID=420261 /ORGANISM="Thalassiosira antarctica, Strain CCMP982" /LENGTH=358 /DNA_ID=CAMNT_0048419285 /DNA_START=40 /DNA_END=1116 /DNA_ORIENTATION=-
MWPTKRKVSDASVNSAMEIDSTSTSSGRSKRKNSGDKRADRQLREFFNNVGASIENIIDSTPFGVSSPEPWSPSTDKKKAMLSNPISVLNTVTETIDASPAKFLGGARQSAWIMSPRKMLMSLREGLAKAVLAEEAFGGDNLDGKMSVDVPVMVELDADAVVPSEAGCEAFVDLGADQWGNTSRAVNPMKEAVSEAKAMKKVTMNKILAFIDNLTLRANGIVVTSDDISVECSLFSLVEDGFDACSPSSPVPGSVPCDEDDFEDCPSVVTEIAMDELEDTEDDTEGVTAEVVPPKEVQLSEEDDQDLKAALKLKDLVNDEDDYVMTEEPDSDEEDFVDVRAEFDITYRPEDFKSDASM